VEVRGPQDLEGAFASLAQSRVDALMVPGSTMLSATSERVVALAATHRLPGSRLRPSGARVLGDRSPANEALKERVRHCLESTAAALQPLSQARSSRRSEKQGGGRGCARALGFRLGHRPAGEAHALNRRTRRTKEPLARATNTRPLANAARPRLENPRGTLLIRHPPATKTLERGSSVTRNSLEATQRPHISLIDRRHHAPLRCPKGIM
jgi:hypothetical protein